MKEIVMLTKEQILRADDLVTQEVDVPEWNGRVFVRTMTGTERDAFEQAMIDGRGKDVKLNMTNVRARLCGVTIVNEKGARLFSDKDINALGAKSAKALDKIYAVAQKLNGLTAEDVEELAKNLGTGQTEDSTSS
jgi:hypothetical protein